MLQPWHHLHMANYRNVNHTHAIIISYITNRHYVTLLAKWYTYKHKMYILSLQSYTETSLRYNVIICQNDVNGNMNVYGN